MKSNSLLLRRPSPDGGALSWRSATHADVLVASASSAALVLPLHGVQRRLECFAPWCRVNCMCLCFGGSASFVFGWNCLKRFTAQVSHPFQGHPSLGCRPLPSLRAFVWGSESRGASRTFGRMLCVGWVHDCSVSAFCFLRFFVLFHAMLLTVSASSFCILAS